MFHYQAFGIGIKTSILLPALATANDRTDLENPIIVEEGDCPAKLVNPPLQTIANCQLNESEFLLTVPGVARYYVQQGNTILIEPLSTYWPSICLYFYSNCLCAVLLQRNRLTMHVSGVFIRPNEVILLAAPSRTGKSTTALKLSEFGYSLFTDDTATLRIANTACYAHASYPMSKLWSKTITQQRVYAEANRQLLYTPELDKFGFMYHEAFVDTEVLVKGIVFLEEKGDQIRIDSIKKSEQIGLIGINIYRSEWALAMRKQRLMFQFCIDLASSVPAWRACRPSHADTFDSFATELQKQVIQNLLA